MRQATERPTLYNSEFHRSTSREVSGDTGAALRFIFRDFSYLYGGEVSLDSDFWVNRYVDDVLNPQIAVHEVRVTRKVDDVVMFALVEVERCPRDLEGKWRVCLYTDFKEDKFNKSLRHVYDAAPVRFFEKKEFKLKCSC